MGYRSDVAYVINFKDADTLKAFVSVAIVKDPKYLNALDECLIDHDNARICFYASDVKWYDSFEDVQWHTALLDLADELYGEQSGGRFIRIGEDMDDLVDLSYGEYGYREEELYVVRDMSVPFNRIYKPTGVSDYLDGLNNGSGNS